MARFIKDRKGSTGQIPGSLILIGHQKMEQPVIQLMEIGADQLEERQVETIEEVLPYLGTAPVSWVNIWGIHDLLLMQKIGETLSLQPLLMEDILNTDQMPRYEGGDSYDAFILKMLQYDLETKRISAEQFSLILGSNYVVTLQEQPGDVFNSVRERIRSAKQRTRFTDADYLAYTLLDTIVDNYLLITESIGREVEGLEERLFTRPDRGLIEEIYTLKTELSFLRKSVRPVREMMGQLIKTENGLFKEKYLHFLRDLNDLVIQATEAIELYSGMISDHLHIYSTNTNNHINEVMKILTIFTAIFIPLTFLVGIYGMNFRYFPELGFRYSYPIFWIVVVMIAAGLLIFFRRKKWF